MSDPESTKTDAPGRRGKQPRSPWWILSAAIHAVILAAIVYFTPWQTVIEQLRAEPKPAEMSAEKTEQIDKALKDDQARQLQRELAQLKQAKQIMEQIEAQRRQDYEQFEKELTEQAPDSITQKLAEAMAAMNEAQKAIDEQRHQDAQTKQVTAEDLQTEVLDLVKILEQIDAEPVKAQEQANQKQVEATEAQDKNRETAQELASTKKQIESSRERLERRSENLQSDEKRVTDLAKVVEETQAKAEETKKAAEDAKANEAPEKTIKNTQNAAEKTQKRLEGHQNSLDKATERRDNTKTEVAQLKETISELEKKEKQLSEQIKSTQAEASKKQQEAVEQQKEAVGALAKALANLPAEQQVAESDESEPQQETPPPQDPAAIYEAARETESEIVELFEMVKAMELAEIRNIPEAAAARSVDTVRPERPELDTEVLGTAAQTTGQLEANKAELEKALRESRSMNAFAGLLVRNAAGGQPGEGDSALGLLALASDGQGQGRSNMATPMTSENESDEQGPNDEGDIGSGGEHTFPKPVINEKITTAPGRVLDAAGRPAQWVVVDDWYMIGPWDNTGRRNLHRQFPPESIVDLDATYHGEGKGGSDLSWSYVKTEHRLGRTEPYNEESYGVWYAYTEIASDEARNVWLAFGSDDRGTVWLNDELIWNSALEHKSWRVGEALVLATLQPGRNRVLYRIENGQYGMAFSMLIHPAEQRPE